MRSTQNDDLKLRLPARSVALAEVRAQLAAFLDAHAIKDEVFSDALLVGHELAANAIAHGSSDDDLIDVRAEIRDGRLRISVADAARRPGTPVMLSPDEWRERGRGLQIVERLAEWSERIVGGRREVRAELPL